VPGCGAASRQPGRVGMPPLPHIQLRVSRRSGGRQLTRALRTALLVVTASAVTWYLAACPTGGRSRDNTLFYPAASVAQGAGVLEWPERRERREGGEGGWVALPRRR